MLMSINKSKSDEQMQVKMFRNKNLDILKGNQPKRKGVIVMEANDQVMCMVFTYRNTRGREILEKIEIKS